MFESITLPVWFICLAWIIIGWAGYYIGYEARKKLTKDMWKNRRKNEN